MDPTGTPPEPAPLPPSSPQPPAPTPAPDPGLPARSPWPWYLATGLILLPGLLGLTGNADAAAVGALLIAPVGALISGIVLGIRVGRSAGTRVLWSGLFFGCCLIASESVAAAGCAVGNPRFNFH
ncbi:MAG: hypothetical protein KF791_13610 [Verrucomicrobiae bacterium]|nr:hypothetical protein [Verrucomicrobiae bacterium]